MPVPSSSASPAAASSLSDSKRTFRTRPTAPAPKSLSEAPTPSRHAQLISSAKHVDVASAVSLMLQSEVSLLDHLDENVGSPSRARLIDSNQHLRIVRNMLAFAIVYAPLPTTHVEALTALQQFACVVLRRPFHVVQAAGEPHTAQQHALSAAAVSQQVPVAAGYCASGLGQVPRFGAKRPRVCCTRNCCRLDAMQLHVWPLDPVSHHACRCDQGFVCGR